MNGQKLKMALTCGVAAGSVSCVNNPYAGKYLSDCKEVFPEEIRAPKDAPNVLWILLDDVGYGAASAFGGLIETPVMDSLARTGLCYTNFHTTALSAPSRAALLTGRNHHTVHMGNFAHRLRRAGFPGYDGIIPSSCGTIAEVLRDNGYNTFALGKYGLTPDNEASDAGPFDHWPQGKGFEHFYGFIASSTDNYNPQLVDELNYVRPDGRHIGELLTERAIQYIDRQKAAAPDKPFFMYMAPSVAHSPIQVGTKWMDLYRGKFDDGWDVYREKVFARQKQMGTIPANAVLPPRESHLPAWESLTPDQKRVCARFMEAYAGYLTYADYEIGRLIGHLREIGQLDNTIIVTMIGDNGAEKKGGLYGSLMKDPKTLGAMKFASPEESLQFTLEHFDLIGHPEATGCDVPVAWAQAMNTPYRLWKGFAESEGGTRNPLIINWGDRLNHGIREQFCHIVDILPTTLEMIGIDMPERIRNIEQTPVQGTSLVYSFDDPQAPERHTEQYFFIYSSRSLYQDGWKLSIQFPVNVFGDEKGLTDQDMEWHLYNLKEDPTEMVDLAARYPKRVKAMKKRLERLSVENNVYPYYRRTDISDKSREINRMTPEERAHYQRLFGGASVYDDVVPVYE